MRHFCWVLNTVMYSILETFASRTSRCNASIAIHHSLFLFSFPWNWCNPACRTFRLSKLNFKDITFLLSIDLSHCRNPRKHREPQNSSNSDDFSNNLKKRNFECRPLKKYPFIRLFRKNFIKSDFSLENCTGNRLWKCIRDNFISLL